jgi:hypothetical protein
VQSAAICERQMVGRRDYEFIAMRLKSLLICALSLYTFASIHTVTAASSNDACDLPKDLQREIASKYPRKTVVTLADLQDDDRGFFQADHDNNCPGLVKVDFYGDGKPTLALVLIGKDEAKESAILVVAHQVEATWNITMLATGGPTVPVVWSLPPGEYRDVYGKKTIRATRPVIVFTKYEAWGILYAWTNNNKVAKIWISD